MSEKKSTMLLLFDVDGTMTAPRLKITNEMELFMRDEVAPRATIGLVGGSDLCKISEQMGGPDVLNKYSFVFSENGLVGHSNGELFHKTSILDFVGEEKLQKMINFCLKYMSELELPAKRGTFIEFRTGLINICPVGRSCSQQERLQFAEFDKENGIRQKFKAALEAEFGDLGLQFALGGQISIDAFPVGWDKTYCLQFVEGQYDQIHFFGDKTSLGGNDYEIFCDSRTVGHTVISPEDTKQQLKQLLKL